MTPQDKQVADYLAEVQANERRKQALDNAVYQLVTNGTVKDSAVLRCHPHSAIPEHKSE